MNAKTAFSPVEPQNVGGNRSLGAGEPTSGVLAADTEMDALTLEALVGSALADGDPTRLREATRALRAAAALCRRHEASGPRALARVRQLLDAVQAAIRQSHDLADLDDVNRLLAAADEGAPHVRLDDSVENLVRRALESRERHLLKAASLALRVVERADRDAGRSVPPRVGELLASVRAAMRGGRAAT